jgi:putative superfamily III holin-X
VSQRLPGDPVLPLVPPVLPSKGERPLSEIVSELWQNAEKLIRQEIALGSSEIETKLDRAKKELGVIATGGAVLYAGVLTLVAALVLLLGTVIALWLAALIIGAVVTGVGFAMARRTPPSPSELVPTQTMASVKQDVRTFTEAAK